MKFSIEESLEFGWKKTREHSRVLFFSLLAMFAVMVSQGLVDTAMLLNDSASFAIVLGLAKGIFVLSMLAMSIGFVVIQLQILRRGKAPSLYALVPMWDVVVRYTAVSLVFGAAFAVSIALALGLFVLGNTLLMSLSVAQSLFGVLYLGAVCAAAVYVSIRFMFLNFVAVDTKGSVADMLSRSYALTRDMFWSLFALVVVIVLLNILGALLFGVGLLVTLPVSMLALGHVYLELSKVGK